MNHHREIILHFDQVVAQASGKKFGDESHPLDFSVHAGEIVVIPDEQIGRHVLRLCVGIGDIEKGKLIIPKNRFEVGFAARMEGNIANLSIWDNMKLPVSYHDLNIDDSRIADLLKEVGIPEGKWNQRPSELDPEHRKKLLLARSVACNPKLLLLDEPGHQIPWVKTHFLIKWIRQRQEQGMAILVSTTNLPLAAYLADQVLDLRTNTIRPKEHVLPQHAMRSAECLVEEPGHLNDYLITGSNLKRIAA